MAGCSWCRGSLCWRSPTCWWRGCRSRQRRNFQPPAVSGNVPIAIAYERSAALHALLLRSGLALLIMTVVSIWLGWVMAGRALRPLRVVTARTREISEENLHERLALTGPRDEVTELSDTIDRLLARLEGAFDSQRSFVANASHELRTPLAMMRTSLDVAAAKPRPMSEDAAVPRTPPAQTRRTRRHRDHPRRRISHPRPVSKRPSPQRRASTARTHHRRHRWLTAQPTLGSHRWTGAVADEAPTSTAGRSSGEWRGCLIVGTPAFRADAAPGDN